MMRGAEKAYPHGGRFDILEMLESGLARYRERSLSDQPTQAMRYENDLVIWLTQQELGRLKWELVWRGSVYIVLSLPCQFPQEIFSVARDPVLCCLAPELDDIYIVSKGHDARIAHVLLDKVPGPVCAAVFAEPRRVCASSKTVYKHNVKSCRRWVIQNLYSIAIFF